MKDTKQTKTAQPPKKKREIGCGCTACLIYLLIAAAIVGLIFAIKTFVISDETKLDIFRHDTPAASEGETDVPTEGILPGPEDTTVPEETAAPEPEPVPPLTVDLYSHSAILADLTDDRVIGEKNSIERAYPASLTKIMTALVALENIPDLQTAITLDSAIYDYTAAQNATTSGYIAGETVTVYELLYGLILPSGADAALALAGEVAGSEAAFAEKMNQKAAELGMNDTHFVNCTGLHDDDHYSTASDLMILVRAALENDIFRAVFTSKTHAGAGTDQHPDGITVRSTVFNALAGGGYTDTPILGGKTGYTDEAGRCLATLAEVDGHEYVLVTLDAGSDFTFPAIDAMNVYGWLAGETEAAAEEETTDAAA